MWVMRVYHTPGLTRTRYIQGAIVPQVASNGESTGLCYTCHGIMEIWRVTSAVWWFARPIAGYSYAHPRLGELHAS